MRKRKEIEKGVGKKKTKQKDVSLLVRPPFPPPFVLSDSPFLLFPLSPLLLYLFLRERQQQEKLNQSPNGKKQEKKKSKEEGRDGGQRWGKGNGKNSKKRSKKKREGGGGVVGDEVRGNNQGGKAWKRKGEKRRERKRKKKKKKEKEKERKKKEKKKKRKKNPSSPVNQGWLNNSLAEILCSWSTQNIR